MTRPAFLPVFLLALLLAGCAAPPLPDPVHQEAPERLWDGSGLEGLDCDSRDLSFATPAGRVQAHLPDNLTARGEDLAQVAVDVFSCRALLLDDGAPMEGAWLYVAYTPLRAAPDVPAEGRYLLEVGSDRPALLEGLAARGVPVLVASFRWDSTGLTVTAPGASYRLLEGDAPSLLLNPSQRTRDLLAGDPATTRLLLGMDVQRQDLPVAGVLSADGGVLGTLLDAPVPVPVTAKAASFLLNPLVNEEEST